MKKIFINLKDYLDYNENVQYIKDIKSISNEVIIFPSNAFLYIYKENCDCNIGIQSFMPEDTGNTTGQVSLKHLKKFNISWAIINHREFPEKDLNTILKKIKKCSEEKINVIICVTQYEIKKIKKVLSKIKNISNIEIIVAFEPTISMDILKITKIINKIKNLLKEEVKVIYGGNVSKDNIIDFEKNTNLYGYLISKNAITGEQLKEILNRIQ